MNFFFSFIKLCLSMRLRMVANIRIHYRRKWSKKEYLKMINKTKSVHWHPLTREKLRISTNLANKHRITWWRCRDYSTRSKLARLGKWPKTSKVKTLPSVNTLIIIEFQYSDMKMYWSSNKIGVRLTRWRRKVVSYPMNK